MFGLSQPGLSRAFAQEDFGQLDSQGAPGLIFHAWALERRACSGLRQHVFGKDAFSPKLPVTAARILVQRDGRGKIICQPRALFLSCAAQQPHEKKKRHHRCHEIRISDLPSTAMMAVAGHDDLFLDDDRGKVFRRHDRSLQVRDRL